MHALVRLLKRVSSRRVLICLCVFLFLQLQMYKRRHGQIKTRTRERLLLAPMARLIPEWREFLFIVRPGTLARRHRAGCRKFWSLKTWLGILRRHCLARKVGRPVKCWPLIAILKQMARENPLAGTHRLHGIISLLGYDISRPTVARYLKRYVPRHPWLVRKRRLWREFLRRKSCAIAAMDFFVVPALWFRPIYCLFIIAHHRRFILHFNVSFHPTQEWVKAQFREAFAENTQIRYVICDNDAIFGVEIVRFLRDCFQIRVKRTGIRSPQQNGIAERWVGTVRRELLDHIVVTRVDHAYRRIGDYIKFYNHFRPHLALGKDTPLGTRKRLGPPGPGARIISIPAIHGLHHRYELRPAA